MSMINISKASSNLVDLQYMDNKYLSNFLNNVINDKTSFNSEKLSGKHNSSESLKSIDLSTNSLHEEEFIELNSLNSTCSLVKEKTDLSLEQKSPFNKFKINNEIESSYINEEPLSVKSQLNENEAFKCLNQAFGLTSNNSQYYDNKIKRQSLPISEHEHLKDRKESFNLNETLFENIRQCKSIDENDFYQQNRVFDDLLFEIYDRWHYGYRVSLDSDTFTDLTESDAVISRNESNRTYIEKIKMNKASLSNKKIFDLRQMILELAHCNNQMSTRLVKQLRTRERQITSIKEKCDIMTAILQASSLKRREDSKIRFSLEPQIGDDAFIQWKDAMKAVVRLPQGIPEEFRKKVWLSLANNYISSLNIDWEKTKKFTFNEKSNPDDNKLGLQIVKDLHRTGCSGFNGQDNEEDRAVLKRVLLAYARWNKQVGYCQGFNILAALILEVVDRKEDSALKVMIYLIDKVLPESYFANNLKSLSVDIAVFRELMRTHVPYLSKHLEFLQAAATDQSAGASYEPPLTNVFTMQWFLTMFATCLSKKTVLRVWDCILLEGSEILLRTAISIWEKLQNRIINITSADEFYSMMGVFSQEMMSEKSFDTEDLVKKIFNMAPFPLPQLMELREKFTYNITPFRAMMNLKNTNRIKPNGTTEEEDEDDMTENINCFAALFPLIQSASNLHSRDDLDHNNADISKVSPGAYTAHPELVNIGYAVMSERVSLDVDMLRKQYKKLMQRQKQAFIILKGNQNKLSQNHLNHNQITPLSINTSSIPVATNHLFTDRKPNGLKNAIVVSASPFIGSNFGCGTLTKQNNKINFPNNNQDFNTNFNNEFSLNRNSIQNHKSKIKVNNNIKNYSLQLNYIPDTTYSDNLLLKQNLKSTFKMNKIIKQQQSPRWLTNDNNKSSYESVLNHNETLSHKNSDLINDLDSKTIKSFGLDEDFYNSSKFNECSRRKISSDKLLPLDPFIETDKFFKSNLSIGETSLNSNHNVKKKNKEMDQFKLIHCHAEKEKNNENVMRNSVSIKNKYNNNNICQSDLKKDLNVDISDQTKSIIHELEKNNNKENLSSVDFKNEYINSKLTSNIDIDSANDKEIIQINTRKIKENAGVDLNLLTINQKPSFDAYIKSLPSNNLIKSKHFWGDDHSFKSISINLKNNNDPIQSRDNDNLNNWTVLTEQNNSIDSNCSDDKISTVSNVSSKYLSQNNSNNKDFNPKSFNPFPKKYLNHRKNKHSVQLGLYPSVDECSIAKHDINYNTFEHNLNDTFDKSLSISQSNYNTCLHRQFNLSRLSKKTVIK